MKHLFSMFAFLTLATTSAAQIPGLPDYSWTMTPETVREQVVAKNGVIVGKLFIYRVPFAGFPDTHPVMGQFYFAPDTLRYIQFLPQYTYQTAQAWQGDVDRIIAFLNTHYQHPQETAGQIVWTAPGVQVVLMKLDTGWIARFNRVQP